MKYIRLFFLLILLQSTHAQFNGYTPDLPIQSTPLYNESNIYQKDFLYLAEGLVQFHANVFMNFPKEEFDKEKEIIYGKLADCKSGSDFGYIVNKFVSRIRDRHTRVLVRGTSGQNNIYPFRCKYLVDSLVIMGISELLPVSLLGEKIQSINGIDIKEIEKRASIAYASENYVDLQRTIMLEINSTDYLKEIEVIKSETESIIVKTYGGQQFEVLPNMMGSYKTQLPTKPLFTDRQPDAFFYKIDEQNSICYIQFNQMVDKRIGEMYINMLPFWKRWFTKTVRFFGGGSGPDVYFEDFMNTCIADIEKNNIKKIVVDLRWNTGGSATLGDILLYSLGIDKYKSFTSDINKSELYRMQMADAGLDQIESKQKDTSDGFAYTKFAKGTDGIKNRFNGDAYFITSEWTFSAAVMLATIVKDNQLFKVVGEPISEKPSHFGEVIFLRLPNTELVCGMSSKLFHRPDKSKANEETLYPDVLIYKTYEDIINGRDSVYEWIKSEPR